MSLAFLVPVLARPQRVKPLLDAIVITTPSAEVLFVVDPDDAAERAEIARCRRLSALRVDELVCAGTYARKIHAAVEYTSETVLFLGADDLKPHAGWFEAAAGRLRGPIQVVGVNDLLERKREHATHFLITRTYAERPTITGGPGPCHQGYAHWYCDDELIATAKKRGVYAYCPESIVEHLHPQGGKAPDDETYRRGRAKRWADAQLFKHRGRHWK